MTADDLLRSAFNPAISAERRLAFARELNVRKCHEPALRALEHLVADVTAGRYEMKSGLECMVELDGDRDRAITLLLRLVEDEPENRTWWGRELVRLGAAEHGWAALRRVALEPGEEIGERARAITTLAKTGQLDVAMAGFRRVMQVGRSYGLRIARLGRFLRAFVLRYGILQGL
jgi:hypothetical protein